ncbi:MAG: Kelch repeat-containing protein [bacterium]
MKYLRIILISLGIVLFGLQFCFAEYWSMIPVKGTHVNARMNYSAVFDTTNHYMYIFGGREYTGSIYTSSKEVYLGYQTDTEYIFNLFPTFGDPIPEREDHSAVIYTNPSTGNLNMIVYGGRDQDVGKIFGDIFQLDLVTHQWTQITTFSGSNPVPRYGHSAVWCNALNSMIVFGGYDTTGQATNNVYAYNPMIPSWTVLTTMNVPPIRAEHAAIIIDSQMYIFGGTDTNLFRNDYWKLDLSSSPYYYWTEFSPTGSPPQARANHTMVYDSDINRILVFGGRGGSVSTPTYLNDVYGFGTSGAFWSQISTRTPNPPLIREGQIAIYDPGYRRMLIFCGGQTLPMFEDMWELFLAIAPAYATIGSSGGTLIPGPAGRYQPQLIIPIGALSGAVDFSLTEADDNHNNPTAVAINPSGTLFNPIYPPNLTLQFRTQDVPLDGSTPATMRIFVWDTTSGTWVKIPFRQTVDTTLNIVTVPIYHLSEYGVGSGHPIPTVEATSTMITAFGGVAQAGPGGTYTSHACACGAGAFPSATVVGTDFPADDHGWSSSYSGSSAVVEFSPDTTLGSSYSSVTIQYLDSDVPAGRSESQMNLYYWNSIMGEWQQVTGVTKDAANNLISASISQLGIYGAGIPVGTDVDINRWELYQ